jgi:hypothetical protein
MTKWIGAGLLALGLIFGGSAPINSAAAAPQTMVQRPQALTITDLAARRSARHHAHYAVRRYSQPYYLDRPNYYAPAPFVPFNFGYGLGPWW